MLTHTGERSHKCKFCQKSFVVKRKLEAHQLTYSGPAVCDVCKLTFESKCELIIHMKIHDGEKLYSCDSCQKSFRKKLELESHLISYPDIAQTKCTDCALTFDRKCGLMVHMKTHKVFKCEKCEKTFGLRDSRKKHMMTHDDEKPYTCESCQKSFRKKHELESHQKTYPDVTPIKCDDCDLTFNKKCGLMIHMKTHKVFKCKTCEKTFGYRYNLKHHLRTHHPKFRLVPVKSDLPLPIVNIERLRREQTALNTFKTLTFLPKEEEECDLDVFQTNLQPELQYSLQSIVREKRAIKWYMVCEIEFVRDGDEGLETICSYFRSECCIDLIEETISDHIDKGYSKIKQSFEEFTQRGSNWRLSKILHMELKISLYKPLAKTYQQDKKRVMS